MAEQVNYNKAFDQRLFGKDTKKSSGKEPENKEDQPPLPQPTDKEQQAKPQPEYKFLSVKIKVPSEGIKQNQPFDFQGEVQPLAGKINKSKVWIKAVAVYKGVKDVIFTEQNNLNIDSKTNTFQGTVKSCHFHDEYLRDNNKPADAKFELHIVADGTGADKEYQGESIKLPMETKQYILKKGTYDKTACDKEANLYKLDGPDFIPDNKITKLQDTIAKLRFKVKDFKPGVFDDVLDAAVRKFQDFAKKPERKIAGDGRVFKADKDKIKFDGATDGEVGPKTENEIAVWVQNKYVKPDIEIMKGNVDDQGVQNGKGKQGSDDHLPGNAVADFQKLLSDIGAKPGRQDGWAADKTFVAVKHVEDCAAKGNIFDTAGKKFVLDDKDKLQGHRDAVGDQPIIDWMKLLYGKSLVVAPQVDYYGGFELKAGDNDSKKLWAGKAATDKTGTFVADMQKDLIDLGFLLVDKPTGNYGPKTEAAIKSFQEAASKNKRNKEGKEVETTDIFKGKSSGTCDQDTAAEIEKWKKNGLKKHAAKDYDAFCSAVGARESGNNYQAENTLGYLGKYQFGMARIHDLSELTKLKDGIDKSEFNKDYEWKSGNSKLSFLNNPTLQDEIFKKHVKNYIKQAQSKFSDKIGTTVKLSSAYYSDAAKCKISEVKITLSGIVGGAHLKGFGGLSKFINENKDGVDANNTHISEYLFLFGGYDLKEAAE